MERTSRAPLSPISNSQGRDPRQLQSRSDPNALKTHATKCISPIPEKQQQKVIRQREARAPPHSIPTSDPESTRLIWSAVISHKEHTARRKQDMSASAGKRAKRRQYIDSGESLVETISTRISSIRPQQLDLFKEHILRPRKISISSRKRVARGPYTHFGTQNPPSSKYNEIAGAQDVAIWVDLDASACQDIADGYVFLQNKKLCEEEFASYAKEMFFRPQPRKLGEVNDRKWRSERLLQLVCRPNTDIHWNQPPLLESNIPRSDDYSWDIRPDCSYWLSMRGFNSDYVCAIDGVSFVFQQWVFAPYLTVEFKKSDEDLESAKLQCAAAASMALYNRFQLHAEANAAASQWSSTITPQDFAERVKHYGITFTGPLYNVWVLKPQEYDLANPSWNGCSMQLLEGGDCTGAAGVKRLAQWINEIHRWALSKHASACQEQIERILAKEGLDVSMLGS